MGKRVGVGFRSMFKLVGRTIGPAQYFGFVERILGSFGIGECAVRVLKRGETDQIFIRYTYIMFHVESSTRKIRMSCSSFRVPVVHFKGIPASGTPVCFAVLGQC